MLTCALCNNELPKNVVVQYREVLLGQERVNAALCKQCTHVQDEIRKRSEAVVCGLLAVVGLLFYMTCCT